MIRFADADSAEASLGPVVVPLDVSLVAVASKVVPILLDRPHMPVSQQESWKGHPAVNGGRATVPRHSPKSEKKATALPAPGES